MHETLRLKSLRLLGLVLQHEQSWLGIVHRHRLPFLLLHQTCERLVHRQTSLARLLDRRQILAMILTVYLADERAFTCDRLGFRFPPILSVVNFWILFAQHKGFSRYLAILFTHKQVIYSTHAALCTFSHPQNFSVLSRGQMPSFKRYCIVLHSRGSDTPSLFHSVYNKKLT